MITINCLEMEITPGHGHNPYPVFIGFASASEILRVAKVPSHSVQTTNSDIASNILNLPIKDWQRPLDSDRVNNISEVYNSIGELMPNPVLLAENVIEQHAGIRISNQIVAGQVTSQVKVVELEEPTGNLAKPLIIIDGQHRINGLALSNYSGNKIPVVILLTKGMNYYTAPTLAKIFAQVTTTAKKLDALHNEWLTYSFRLNKYDGDDESLRKSMETTALLCSKSTTNSNLVNPFFNNIKFNISQSANPRPGGFHYNCIELTDIIDKNYYNLPMRNNLQHLDPDYLKDQIVYAHSALENVVTNANDSVFFGRQNKWQKIMTDSFISSILSLLRSGPLNSTVDYQNIFRQVNFHTTDWDFSNWVTTLSGGSVQNTSKKVADKVFMRLFSNPTLPNNVTRLDDYFRGNASQFTVEHFNVNNHGRKVKNTIDIQVINQGARLAIDCTGKDKIKIQNGSISPNIGKIDCQTAHTAPIDTLYFDLENGIDLNTLNGNSIELIITLYFYGNQATDVRLTIRK